MQLVVGDVGVAADRREIGVAEVGGDQACVAGLLTEPGGGCVAERVRGDSLLEPGSLGSTPDDQPEDRPLQPPAFEPAEDGLVGGRRDGRASAAELACERKRKRLPARLAAFAAADEE